MSATESRVGLCHFSVGILIFKWVINQMKCVSEALQVNVEDRLQLKLLYYITQLVCRVDWVRL